jgi:hypothetical protein
MERHLSTGTATLVALMAAHRLAQDQSHGPHTLDDFFRQEAARVDGYFRALNGLGARTEQATKRLKERGRSTPGSTAEKRFLSFNIAFDQIDDSMPFCFGSKSI